MKLISSRTFARIMITLASLTCQCVAEPTLFADEGQNVELTSQQLADAQTVTDQPGMRWAARLDNESDNNFLSMPARAINAGFDIYAPFEHFYVDRRLIDGLTSVTARAFSDPLGQIVSTDNPRYWPIDREPATAFTFAAKAKIPKIVVSKGDAPLDLVGHEIAPWRVLFSPNGRRLLSCSDDGSLRLWDVDNGKQIAIYKGTMLGPNRITLRGQFFDFSPNGRWFARLSGDRVVILDPTDGREISTWQPVGPGGVNGIQFSRDEKSVFAFVSTAADGKDEFAVIKQLEINLNTPTIHSFDGSVRGNFGIECPDEKHLVICNLGLQLPTNVSVWDIASRRAVAAQRVAPHSLYNVAISPRGNVLATAGDDGELALWELPTLRRLDTKLRHNFNAVHTLRFSDDGKYLFAVGEAWPSPQDPEKVCETWLKVWDAPECVWSTPREIVHTDISADGTVRSVAADGFVSYSKALGK